MRKLTVILGLLLLTLSFEQKANAQDTPKPAAPPAHYYHLALVDIIQFIQRRAGEIIRGRPE